MNAKLISHRKCALVMTAATDWRLKASVVVILTIKTTHNVFLPVCAPPPSRKAFGKWMHQMIKH